MAGFVVVGGSSVPALIVVVFGGVRLASRTLVLRAVDLLVAVLVAAKAADGRLLGWGIGA